jgi:tetratricopeptide (TPR) repeat protein
MLSLRRVLATGFVFAGLVASILALPRRGSAEEPYRKPPPPITGAPAWKWTPNAKVDADRLEAARLYVRASGYADLARADLATARKNQATAGADPKAVRSAKRTLDAATKRLELARETFRRATELDSTCADCWSMLGYTCRYTGDREGALEAFARCLAINPNHFQAHEYQGESYLLDGRVGEARAELDWLKARGNMTTLETTTLAAAIDRWTTENPQSAAPDSTTN